MTLINHKGEVEFLQCPHIERRDTNKHKRTLSKCYLALTFLKLMKHLSLLQSDLFVSKKRLRR